jgi:hypothetical protein
MMNRVAEVVSVEHPLGVMKSTRKKTQLAFRLEEMKDGMESGDTRQASEVMWCRQSKIIELQRTFQ